MKKNLTFRYTLQQVAYWAAAAGVMSFASAYLLAKGLPASLVGTLLSLGSLLSCAVQPVLAERADRLGADKIKYMIAALSLCCMAFFGALLAIPMSTVPMGICYLFGIFTFDAMMPLLNAVSVSCNNAGMKINYGVGRGIGSLAYSLAALGLGRIIADFGEDWMIWAILALMAFNIIISLGYPSAAAASTERRRNDSCSIITFFCRYRRYCFSLLGVLLLGAFHAMTENFMIKIFDRLGGGSAEVGVALFVATAIEAVVLLFFEPIRRRISEGWLLKIAGLSFLLKSFLFIVSGSVEAIYLVQLLQATSYSFLAPTQVFYAEKKVRPEDMVKGQAFITAAYSLGCAGGNFAGGFFIEHFGVGAMLWFGVVLAALGTGVFFLTVNKKDKCIMEALAPSQSWLTP
ncbi:MAG: MFS transporter [Oscillospiraceae bacterium]|nr:MFS transporter [Oscillospiraceae bacterium]